MRLQGVRKIPVSEGGTVVVDMYGDVEQSCLLVVPGALNDASDWSSVAKALNAWDCVAVMNRRGRAPSSSLPKHYSICTEVEDVKAVLESLPSMPTLFGWSYGGTVALLTGNDLPFDHAIIYEPVAAPFGADALPSLSKAASTEDLDLCLEIIYSRIGGLTDAQITAARADRPLWEKLRMLSRPAYAELQALNDTSLPDILGAKVSLLDMIVGENDKGHAPYGTSFDSVLSRTDGARIHELPGEGHLAHLHAPTEFAAILNSLRRTTSL